MVDLGDWAFGRKSRSCSSNVLSLNSDVSGAVYRVFVLKSDRRVVLGFFISCRGVGIWRRKVDGGVKENSRGRQHTEHFF